MPVANASNAKRRKILEVATNLFLKEGYGAASMSELLRLVGGSKTTIYTHFGDKAGLFTAIVDELLNETVAFTDPLNLSALSVHDALLEIAQQHLKVVLSDRYISLIRIVAAEVGRFPELGKAFYDHGPGRSYLNFIAFLDERVARGELDVEDTSRATDLFFGTLLHREVLSRLYGVKTIPLRNRKAVAVAVTDEFIKRYRSQA
ncbi:MAG: TetR/AcrR family transcriptional regulator [Proteobacteria bacterium]|nr:TetR/AcrR family transcriptional regulator [Pseudomonadota bacterium]